MARMVSIPARVAIGFLEPDDLGNGNFEYSSYDLHAWPELYFEDAGWVRFEPTPSARADDGARLLDGAGERLTADGDHEQPDRFRAERRHPDGSSRADGDGRARGGGRRREWRRRRNRLGSGAAAGRARTAGARRHRRSRADSALPPWTRPRPTVGRDARGPLGRAARDRGRPRASLAPRAVTPGGGPGPGRPPRRPDRPRPRRPPRASAHRAGCRSGGGRGVGATRRRTRARSLRPAGVSRPGGPGRRRPDLLRLPGSRRHESVSPCGPGGCRGRCGSGRRQIAPTATTWSGV